MSFSVQGVLVLKGLSHHRNCGSGMSERGLRRVKAPRLLRGREPFRCARSRRSSCQSWLDSALPPMSTPTLETTLNSMSTRCVALRHRNNRITPRRNGPGSPCRLPQRRGLSSCRVFPKSSLSEPICGPTSFSTSMSTSKAVFDRLSTPGAYKTLRRAHPGCGLFRCRPFLQ